MKKIVFNAAVLLFALSGARSGAQVLYNNTFSSSLGTASANNGFDGNWVWTNSCNQSNSTGHTAPGSAIFEGNGSTCTYEDNINGNQTYGDLDIPTVNTGNFGAVLTFNYFIENECSSFDSYCIYDILTLQVSVNGGGYNDVMNSDFGGGFAVNNPGWVLATYTLPANQPVDVRFNFNTQDPYGNYYDGIYIDDVKIENIPGCTGAPATNTSIATDSLICPNIQGVDITLQNAYTVGGLNYAWQSSTTSSLGLYTAVSGAPSSGLFTVPGQNAPTWYRAVITCAANSLSIATLPVFVNVQLTTTNSVYYIEDFEGISDENQLPNCSWYSPDINNTAYTYTNSNTQNRVPRSGDNFASFYYFPNQNSNFYSNGIWLDAGITYSATVWYTTESYGYTNWDLELNYGPNQSASGMVAIATKSQAASASYKALTNTFQVSTSGLYYINVGATSNSNGYADYLSWDDLEISIPCSLNTPVVNIAAVSTTICSGQAVNLTATGADDYTWNTGATGDNLIDFPTVNTLYTVVGTNTISGCPSPGVSQYIVVNQTPPVVAMATKLSVCPGDPLDLIAFGASSYSWSSGTNGQAITVFPAGNTSYTVNGTGANGCVGTSVVNVNVKATPVIAVSGPTMVCRGDGFQYIANGALSYLWMAPNLYLATNGTNPAVITANGPNSYTVVGTNADGCKGSYVFSLNVQECIGLADQVVFSGIRIYPNPTSGILTVEPGGETLDVAVTDVTGRLVLAEHLTGEKVQLDLSSVANGIYYARFSSGVTAGVVKIVKQ